MGGECTACKPSATAGPVHDPALKALCLFARVPKHVCDLLHISEPCVINPTSAGIMCERGCVHGVQRCSTSYVRLPADYPKLQSSHRPQDLGILWNDTWVSVTSGSEDYSFKVCNRTSAAPMLLTAHRLGYATCPSRFKWLAA